MSGYDEYYRAIRRAAGGVALRAAREAGLSDADAAMAIYNAMDDAVRQAPAYVVRDAPWHCDLCGASEIHGDTWRDHDCLGALAKK
jgi:hypothetical protein